VAGRLLGNTTPEIQRFVNQTAESKNWPWLRPFSSNLTASGGPLIRTLEGHTFGVDAVAVTPDGRHALSASDDQLRLWDLESGQTIRTLEGHTFGVNAVTMTSDCRHALSGSRDCTVRLWHLGNGQTIRLLEGHTGPVFAVAVTPDGLRAVSGSLDRTLRLWDLESGLNIRILKGHTDWIHAVTMTAEVTVHCQDPKTKRCASGIWKSVE
jgi:WD40 repeat protein